MSEIKTTGQLRELLAQTIVGVVNGSVEIDDANAVHKLSKNISDSLYSETKIKMFSHEIGQAVPDMGDLPLGGTD